MYRSVLLLQYRCREINTVVYRYTNIARSCGTNFKELHPRTSYTCYQIAQNKVYNNYRTFSLGRPFSTHEKMNGARIIASALKSQGVECIFGIVGIPVVEVALAAQEAGIKFIAMRNEQAASYAASAYGYLTQRPGVCLVVSGPGLIHALSGMANAQENNWPLLVIGGASEQLQESLGAFQEYPQVEASRICCKFAARPTSIARIPFYVEKAIRMSLYGRPGVSYLDLPGDMIEGEISESISYPPQCPPPPVMLTEQSNIQKAVEVLKSSQRPLIIVGKGAAYSCAEKHIQELVSKSNIPFLPTPMGKGVVPDLHSLCISPARSRALLEADVILLLAARLNWILHFGHPPRFNPSVKIIQVDLHPEELHNNVHSSIALAGDIGGIAKQLTEEITRQKWSFPSTSVWRSRLKEKIDQNKSIVEKMVKDHSVPLNYYAAFKQVQDIIPPNCIIVNEGANTMDIGRSMLFNQLPRHRLDAGTFGTMGVGLGFATAAALWCQEHHPEKRVICVEGDSAFGFSGMEFETMHRYKLPVVIIIMNNNGIYSGFDENSWNEVRENGSHVALSTPATCLTPAAHYENITKMFGGKGFFVKTIEELQDALKEALNIKNEPTLINVMINPFSQRKEQEFQWLTKSNL